MNKKLIYAVVLDLVFLCLLLLTLTSERLILGGYLGQISQYGNLKEYTEVNQNNVQEVEKALSDVEPVVKKAETSQYLINFVLLVVYTILMGSSWLLIGDKSLKNFNFKKYYLKFGIISLIYFYLIYKLLFVLIDAVNFYDYFLGGSLNFNEGFTILITILAILIISFVYLIFSCEIGVKSIKEELLRLKNKSFFKIILFIILFLFLSVFLFLFLVNFFDLFINYLTGLIGLFGWYSYTYLLILFLIIECLRIFSYKVLVL